VERATLLLKELSGPVSEPPAEAYARLREATDLLLGVPLEEAQATREALYDLASRALELGAIVEARRAWERLESLTASEARDDPLRLQTLESLGWSLHLLGDDLGARSKLESALIELEAQWPDSPRTQRVRLKLAAVLRSLGDLETAGTLANAAARALEQSPASAEDHAAASLELASIEFDLGDIHSARSRLEALLTSLAQHPGSLTAERVSLLLTLQESLAAGSSELGDLDGALALQEKIVAAYSALLPQHHTDVLRAKWNLASTRARLGDLAGALPLLEEVLERMLRLLPPDHPDVTVARQRLAQVLRLEGEDARAAEVEAGRWP
jgi:tetratricopeptide (TPR) repeat protein